MYMTARIMESSENKMQVRRKCEAYVRGAVKSENTEDPDASKPIEGHHVFSAGLPQHMVWGNPVDFAFKPHSGAVTAIAFSPFNRHVFLTVSSDGGIRLYSTKTSEPVNYFQPAEEESFLYDVVWSEVRPLVFAVCSAQGHIWVFDIGSDMTSPAVSLLANEHKQAVTSLAWNKKEPSVLASADVAGKLTLWQLGDKFTVAKQGEKAFLDMLCHKDNDSSNAGKEAKEKN